MNSVCRACLGNTEDRTSIFEDQQSIKFCEMLTYSTGVLVSEFDDFPKIICQSCSVELPKVWRFVKMCRTSDESLRKAINALDTSTTSIIDDFKVEIKEEVNLQSGKSDRSSDAGEDPDPDISLYIKSKKKTNFISRSGKNGKRKKTASDRSQFACGTCQHISQTSARLKKHIARNHPSVERENCAEYPCRACAKVFKRKCDLVVHHRTHSGERPFACPQCPRRFAQSGTLIEHRRCHTGEKPFACGACARRFSSRSSLWRHRVVHTRERPFACERCGATFAHASSLKHHALVHSGERPHRCGQCGRRAKSPYALRQHMLTHADKAFVCECCGKKFSMKSNLASHTRKMHSERAGRCAVCRKETSDLEEHMRQHSALAPYCCPVCARSFRQKNSLTFHLAMHTNAQKYKCSVQDCGKAFPKQNMLDFHILKVHSAETPHICRYCSKGFFRTSDLSRHINTLHPDESLANKR